MSDTPRRWELQRIEGGEELWFPDGFWSAGPAILWPDEENSEADARLIVAAPETARERDELLAVLEELMGDGRLVYEPRWCADARAAVAKAKGQTDASPT